MFLLDVILPSPGEILLFEIEENPGLFAAILGVAILVIIGLIVVKKRR